MRRAQSADPVLSPRTKNRATIFPSPPGLIINFYSPAITSPLSSRSHFHRRKSTVHCPISRRVRVCVCLYCFASLQNSVHTRLMHPCIACPSRRTDYLHFHKHRQPRTIPAHKNRATIFPSPPGLIINFYSVVITSPQSSR